MLKSLARYMALTVAEALTDWADAPPGAGDRISRVIMAYGMQPIAIRGTKADIEMAARNLATQTKGCVMVMELVKIVPHAHTEERN